MEETKTIKVLDLSNRFYILILVLVLGVVAYYATAAFSNYQNLPSNYPNQLIVTGTGKSFVKPDIAEVVFGTNTQGLKSQDVVDQNNQTMNSVITALKALGIADKDIQTTGYNLNPVYDYTNNQQVFKGYSLDQQITVKIRNFDSISGVLDKATSLGVTTVGNLQFTVDDPIAAEADARAQAIAQAKEKATSIANQSGLQIAKLINVTDGSQPDIQPMLGQSAGVMAPTANVAPQIQTGQMEVDSTVTLTYLLK